MAVYYLSDYRKDSGISEKEQDAVLKNMDLFLTNVKLYGVKNAVDGFIKLLVSDFPIP